VATLISFDWDFTFSINPVYVIIAIVIVAVIVIIAYIWMMCTARSLSGDTDELKHGAEAKTWEEIAEERKRTIQAIKIITTASLSIYLPVSKMTMQVMACDYALMNTARTIFAEIKCVDAVTANSTLVSAASCDCSGWGQYGIFQGVCVFLILVFVLGLPILCYTLIQRNKPVGSEADPSKRFVEVNGKEVLMPYSAAMYQQDLRTDPRQLYNPFLFLYEGYDRDWAFYKVIVMVFKLLLVLPAIFLARQGTLATALALLVVLAIYAGLSFYSKPFINPQADRMDATGRIASVMTVAFSLVGSPQVAPGTNVAMGILINVVNVLNFLILAALMLYSLPPVKRWLKNRTARFTFSNSILDVSGRSDDIVHDWVVYDELRNRIWRPFWQSLFMQADPTVPDPADKEAVKEAKSLSVEERQLSITRRLLAQRQIAATIGVRRVKEHWRTLTYPGMLDNYAWVQRSLEGVDVFYDGLPHDGHVDWTTAFGKMYVRTYPFACVVVYDEGGDHEYVYGGDGEPAKLDTARKELQDLMRSKPFDWRSELVRRMSTSYHAAREMEASSDARLLVEVVTEEDKRRRIMTPFERLVFLNGNSFEVRRRRYVRVRLRAISASGKNVPLNFEKSVQRTVTWQETDSEGKSVTKSQSITVHLTFSRAISTVAASTSKAYAAGFKADIIGIDGQGTGTDRRGVSHTFTNQRESAGVRLGPTYEEVDLLAQFLGSSEAATISATGIAQSEAELVTYRAELYARRAKEEQALSNAFYAHVYDAFPLPRSALEAYLMDFESNPVMKAIPEEHAAGLDFLFARVHRVTQHPVAAFWFLFFQDLWAENNEMGCFKDEELRKKWDPRYPDAMCYRPMPREDLVAELKEQKLQQSRGLFNDALVDLLYSEIESRATAVPNPVAGLEETSDV